MMGKTHLAGGALGMLVSFEIMRRNNMLIPDLNPFVQLAVMYPAATWGSVAPDLDHHWESVGMKTPANKLFHKILHLSRPKHRSWQTHSLLVTGGFLFLLYSLVLLGDKLFGVGTLGSTDWIIVRLLVMGAIVGVASHLLLDALSVGGIWVYPGLKVRLVPKSSFFATGSTWESIVYMLCSLGSLFMLVSLALSVLDIDLIGSVMAML